MWLSRFRIAIDGYNLAMPNGTGVATYGFTLAQVLRQAGHRVDGVYGLDAGSDPQMREILFFEALGRRNEPVAEKRRKRDKQRVFWASVRPSLSLKATDVPQSGRVEIKPLAELLPVFDRLSTTPRLFPIAHRHFARYGRFVRLRMDDPPPIMHWTYPVPIELVGSRNIYTLHDLVPLRLPYTTLEAKTFYRRLVQGCIDRAAALCTVSETSRNDIIAEFGVAPDRITNTFQTTLLPAGFLDTPAALDAAVVEATLGLPEKGYFLYCGAVEPKKNVGRLLEAYLSLGTDTPLALAGGGGWQNADELRLLTQPDTAESDHGRGLPRRVIRLGHLPRALLLRVIRGARAVLVPSIYEGFGLPVLEAMQLGTPVLTSRDGALAEVAGNAALLVDPYSVPSIAAGLRALDADEAVRRRLAAAGPIQAAHFLPERYLERLERLYTSSNPAAAR